MNNYDVDMIRGGSYGYQDVRVRIETDNRVLLDNIMSAIDQVYDAWHKGKINSHDDRVKVEVV